MYFTFILVDLYFTQCVMQYVHKTNYATTRKKIYISQFENM